MPLDETALRRPGFAEGVPIVLADGRAWSFPRPTFDVLPRFDDAGAVVGTARAPQFGADYERLLDAFESVAPQDSVLVQMMGLAAYLLRQNYNLGPDDLRGLLRFRGHDPDNVSMWWAIARVARGLDLEAEDDPGPKGPGDDTAGPA